MALSGPYCPYCQNATREWKANPEQFDILDHVRRCSTRKQKHHECATWIFCSHCEFKNHSGFCTYCSVPICKDCAAEAGDIDTLFCSTECLYDHDAKYRPGVKTNA